MRVLLVEPREHPNVLGLSRFICVEPLALEILAANLLDAGHEVRILDMRHDPDLPRALQDFQPRLVGITGYTPDAPEMLRIARVVKDLNSAVCVVVGGHHATMCPSDFDCPWVDAIVSGDGEVSFREVCRAVERAGRVGAVPGVLARESGSLASAPSESALATLDHTPFPARSPVESYRPDYFFWFWDPPVPVETARGCPYRCNYCSVWSFNRGASRFRSAEGVLAELLRLPSGTRSVFFADDHFLQHMPRAVSLADMIDREGLSLRYSVQTRSDSVVRRPDVVEKWARVGLFTAFVGFEAFRQADLVRMHKSNSVHANEEAARILRANDVYIWGAFIVDPQWLEDDFSRLIEYVRALGVDFPQFTVMTPLPGTEIFAQQRSWLTTKQHHLFDLAHAVVPTRLPLEHFYEQMARLYRETTFSLSDVKRLIRAGRFPVDVLRRAKDVLQHMTDPSRYLAGHDPSVYGPPMRVATMSCGADVLASSPVYALPAYGLAAD